MEQQAGLEERLGVDVLLSEPGGTQKHMFG